MFATSALSQLASKPVQSSAGPPLLRLLVYCGRKKNQNGRFSHIALLSFAPSKQRHNWDKFFFRGAHIMELSIKGMVLRSHVVTRDAGTIFWPRQPFN